MDPVGFALTIIWFAVLFGGGALVAKSKNSTARKIYLAILIAIPAIYILVWLFS
jgi:hypothetical protein